MFYKITETGLEKAPNMFEINGKYVFTNSEKIYNENGYYKVKTLPRPQDNNAYKSIYRFENNTIIGDWEIIEAEPLPYKDRVVARIREIYTIDDEIQLLAERFEEPELWAAYRTTIERIKSEERNI